jgi:MtrB/PioB family decaheme-associated outer membrane protein
MRIRFSVLAAAVLLAAASARAQGLSSGSVDFGVSSTNVTGDAARFQRYSDRRDRAAVETFRLDQFGDGWHFESNGRHLGREDQWLAGRLQTAKFKVSFGWDQIPDYLSADTRTAFRTEAPGVLRLDGGIRQAVQNGQLGMADFAREAGRFDLRSRRDVASFDFIFSPTRDLDVKLNLKQTRREGTQPFFGSFGFSDAVELAAPVDTLTRDVNAGIEWARAGGSLRLGYDGSWFDNNVPSLVWDNPLKVTDSVSDSGYRDGLAGAQGRMALWPGNTMQGISSAGSIKLPARTRVAASLRAGISRQNQPLLPVTINSAAPALPLPRATAEAEARTVATNVSVTSRPAKYLWMNARYRSYDFDNRTPLFATPWLVMDQTLHASTAIEPTSYTRRSLDLDGSLTPFQATTFRLGYTRGSDDRTFRIFERTAENTYRASADSVWKAFTFRGSVERAERRGSGFDEHLLTEAGEQPALRHYDVADRDRHRVTGLVQITPLKALAVSGSLALGHDDYANSGFGLRDNENRAYTITVDVAPVQRIGATVMYSKERYRALQQSRNASPGIQVTDPTRDWSLDSSDKYDTIDAGLDLLKVLPRTDLHLTYDYSRSTTAYVYGVPAGSTLVAPVQLPSVRNALRSATGELRFFLTRQVALGAIYWYDDYQVDDFARDPETIGSLAPTGSLFLGAVYRPFTANSASLRLTYIW